MWWIDVCDVGVVSGFAGPYTGTGWAAQGDGAMMVTEESSLLDQVFLHVWHVLQRVHVQILIVCQDKNDVRLPSESGRRIVAEGCLVCPYLTDGY